MKVKEYKDEFITERIEATEESSEFKEKLEKFKGNKEHYKIGIGKMALVRATDILTTKGKIEASSKSAFVTKQSSGYRSAIIQILREQNSELWMKSLFDDAALEEVKKIQDPYIPYSSQYRSTIHFTINSLVGNHSAGNFDNYPYIIIEPLNKHINEENIVSIRPEDTFFKQEIELSTESVILMEEKLYQKLSYEKRQDITRKTKIYTYNGDKKIAIQKLLISLGYIPEEVSSHGLIESKTSKNLQESIEEVVEERKQGMVQTEENSEKYLLPHVYTNEYKEDDEKSLIIWEKYDRAFLKCFVKEFGLGEEKIEELLDFSNGERIMESLIREQGIEKYKKVVEAFNNEINKKIKNGTMPTNEELINGKELDVDIERILTEEKHK